MHILELKIVSATLPKKQNDIVAIDALNSYISHKQMGSPAKLQNKKSGSSLQYHRLLRPSAMQMLSQKNIEGNIHTYINVLSSSVDDEDWIPGSNLDNDGRGNAS